MKDRRQSNPAGRKRTAVETLDELTDAMADGGPLLVAWVAWRLLGISKQRFYQLLARGKLDGVNVKGVTHVTLRQVKARLEGK